MPHQTRYTGNTDVNKLGSILVITTLFTVGGNKKFDQQTSPAETTKTLTVPKKTKETGVLVKTFGSKDSGRSDPATPRHQAPA